MVISKERSPFSFQKTKHDARETGPEETSWLAADPLRIYILILLEEMGAPHLLAKHAGFV